MKAEIIICLLLLIFLLVIVDSNIIWGVVKIEHHIPPSEVNCTECFILTGQIEERGLYGILSNIRWQDERIGYSDGLTTIGSYCQQENVECHHEWTMIK